MIRRINLYGGSGLGKSATCAFLYHQLKKRHYNVEQIQEAIKPMAIQGIRKKSFDAVWLFGKQLHKEDLMLANGIDHVVTDSPVLTQTFYSEIEGHSSVAAQLDIAAQFEAVYPSLHIMLSREGVPFDPIGRYEKTIEEAELLDRKFEAFLNRLGISYMVVPTIKEDLLLRDVLGVLEMSKR